MKKVLAYSSIVFAAPFVAFAEGAQYTTANGIGSVIGLLSGLVNALIPLMIGAALVAFFWGLIMYIYKGACKKGASKALMIWALVALFVMVSVWGLINLLQDSLGITGNETVPVPKVPTSGSAGGSGLQQGAAF